MTSQVHAIETQIDVTARCIWSWAAKFKIPMIARMDWKTFEQRGCFSQIADSLIHFSSSAEVSIRSRNANFMNIWIAPDKFKEKPCIH